MMQLCHGRRTWRRSKNESHVKERKIQKEKGNLTLYSNMAWKDRILQGKNLQFLESLARDNLSAYRIIFYMKSAPDDATTSYGVLGNTETGRIVAFYLKDAFPE